MKAAGGVADTPAVRRIRIVEYLQDPDVPFTKSPEDPRVTHPLGRWMRRYSLDELPQILQVVTGHLALAGPRPLTAKELDSHYGQASGEVLSVKPGITGMWQVGGRSKLTYDQRLQLDLEYVRSRTLLLYWRILLRTFPAIMRGEDAY
jgi:lipopolysaccharide/colanic/teichoic acid biosynthesis glycosyltransferase